MYVFLSLVAGVGVALVFGLVVYALLDDQRKRHLSGGRPVPITLAGILDEDTDEPEPDDAEAELVAMNAALREAQAQIAASLRFEQTRVSTEIALAALRENGAEVPFVPSWSTEIGFDPTRALRDCRSAATKEPRTLVAGPTAADLPILRDIPPVEPIPAAWDTQVFRAINAHELETEAA